MAAESGACRARFPVQAERSDRRPPLPSNSPNQQAEDTTADQGCSRCGNGARNGNLAICRNGLYFQQLLFIENASDDTRSSLQQKRAALTAALFQISSLRSVG